MVNNGNKLETGKFWQMQHCDGHNHVHDREQHGAPGIERDALAGNVLDSFGGRPGTAPVYAAGAALQRARPTPLGAHLVKRMIEKRMIIDPDHLSVRARQQLLDIVEEAGYSGIISSHTWSTPDAIPRIYRLGGFVTPYAGAAKDFVDAVARGAGRARPALLPAARLGRGHERLRLPGRRRATGRNPVTYPFKSFDGKVTIDKQRSGQRVYDINVDGVAHYGLYPDWVEDLRKQAGEEIVDDLAAAPRPTCRCGSAPTASRPAAGPRGRA